MSEALGVLDAVEALVLEAKRFPLTEKVILEERDILSLVDKLRKLINNRDSARAAVDLSKKESVSSAQTPSQGESLQSQILIDNAKKEAADIRQNINEYADNVLAKLQLMVTKFQKDTIRMERNISEGRSLLDERSNKEEVKYDPTRQ